MVSEMPSSTLFYVFHLLQITVFSINIFFSLQEFGQEELGPSYGPYHHQVETERKSREHILELKHALAKQVTQRSKEVAGKQIITTFTFNGQS